MDTAIAKAHADGRGEAIIGEPRFGSAESVLQALETELRAVAFDISKAGGKKKKRGYIFTGRGTE